MDTGELQERLDDLFDQGLLFHCFTEYLRDYELVAHCTADPRTGIAPANLRFLFRYCVQATIESAVAPETWRVSLDERLIRYETGVDLDGYVWGVNWSVLYPGASIVADSATAARWADAVGIDFHEVLIETNGHNLRLVFSDLEVTEVGEGYRPLGVGPGGPDGKFPLG